MRNAILAVVAAFGLCASAEAQCARVVSVNVGGFRTFAPTLSTVPFAVQSFAVPFQSFAVQQQFAAPVAVQQVRIRRGLFGRVRRIDTVSVGGFGAVGVGGFRGVRVRVGGFRGRCF